MKLIFIIFILLLFGCTPNHPFREGSCAKMKLDGRKGMVVSVEYHGVWVRLSSFSERTNTHLISQDGNISKNFYTLNYFYLYEITPCEFDKDENK
jgi:hypothetical protein